MADKGSGSTAVGRKKRTKLSEEQVEYLEMSYAWCSMPYFAMKKKIATDLGLTIMQVTNWFQNKRTKEKTKMSVRVLEIDIQFLRDEMEKKLETANAKAEEMEKHYLSSEKKLEIANANAETLKAQMMAMERQIADLRNREIAAQWDPMGWSQWDGFTTGTNLEAAAAVVNPHVQQDPMEQANTFNNGDDDDDDDDDGDDDDVQQYFD